MENPGSRRALGARGSILMSTNGMCRRTLPYLLCLAVGTTVAACETKYPNGPPLREVETEDDRRFVRCVSRGIYRATPGCESFVGGQDR
jgi:hypothetical protein